MEQEGPLCIACQTLDLRLYLFQDAHRGSIELGSFQEILKRDNCSFCKMIVQALSYKPKGYWVEGVYPSEVCYIGRRRANSHRPILEVWFDSTSETLPKGMFGHSTTHGEILAVDDEAGLTESRPEYTGRVVESSVNFSLLRSWLTECDKNHGEKCRITAKNAPLRGQYLIDVKRRCLVKCEKDYRYLALSYVWGKAPMLRALKSNLTQLQEDGALEAFGHQIPIVIRDAMQAVASLCENYLWVDALCIVQDDEISLEQISRMDIIYHQAIATIFAIAGEDSNTGLPGILPNSRYPRQVCQKVKGITLVTKLADLSQILDQSCWASRAWTLQEGIFSRRCLYFTEHQIYFQCRSSMRREDMLNECFGSSADYNPLEREILATEKAYSPIFCVYEAMVKVYTRRKLSYESDILNAFTGIMSAMKERFDWEFLSALPVASLDLALLWRPMASSYPRFPSTQDSAKLPSGPFPSWCWTTMVGEIYWDPWRLAGYAGNEITISPEIEYFIVKKGASLRVVETEHRAKVSNLPPATLVSFDFTAPGLHVDLPILCFWAKTVSLDNLILSYEKQYPKQDSHPLPPILRNWLFNKVWIYDSAHNHCGTLTGLESWPLSSNFKPAKYELVLLSRCHQAVITKEAIKSNLHRLPLEFPSSQEYYDEIFDSSHFKPTVDCAANIMLIEWKGDDYAVRIAIGQIHIDAWESTDAKKLIRLA
ncbi:Heterokaryon incompatibility protein (HET) domain containing protein [Hyaloscypha variabilis]